MGFLTRLEATKTSMNWQIMLYLYNKVLLEKEQKWSVQHRWISQPLCYVEEAHHSPLQNTVNSNVSSSCAFNIMFTWPATTFRAIRHSIFPKPSCWGYYLPSFYHPLKSNSHTPFSLSWVPHIFLNLLNNLLSTRYYSISIRYAGSVLGDRHIAHFSMLICMAVSPRMGSSRWRSLLHPYTSLGIS